MKKILLTSIFLCFSGAFEMIMAQAPVITDNPSDAVICSGGDATFKVVATNSPTTYNWQVAHFGSAWGAITDVPSPFTLTYSGANTATLIVHTLFHNAYNGFKFRCIASNGG